jgi:hypothetical protein
MPRKIPSPWGRSHKPVTPARLRVTFGDAQQSVLVSFYAAPECVIEVLVDSGLPLDLDLEERCQQSVEIRSFRDLLPQLWDAYPDQWTDPPNLGRYRRQQLAEEQRLLADGDDFPSLWDLLYPAGSTWCHGPPL